MGFRVEETQRYENGCCKTIRNIVCNSHCYLFMKVEKLCLLPQIIDLVVVVGSVEPVVVPVVLEN